MRYSLVAIFMLIAFWSEAQFPFDGKNSQPLFKYYTYLEDPSGSISPTEATAIIDTDFVKWNDGITFNVGITSSVYWFYIPIENVTDETQEAILKLSTKLDNVSLYELGDNRVPSLISTSGSYVPYDQRPFPLRYICFPVSLSPKSSKSLLMRVDNRGMGLYMPMYLLSVEEILRVEVSRHWMYGIYFGVFIFIIIFNVFLYFSLRDKIHLWYSAYVLSAILFMVQDEKFYTEIYPDSLLFFFENAWVPPFSLLLMATSLRVMQLFVRQQKDNSRFYYPTQLMILFCFSLSGVMLLLSLMEPRSVLPVLRKLYIATDLFTSLTILLVIFSVLEKIRQRLVIYYFVAVILMILGALNYYFNHLGILNINFLKPNGVVVGLAFELTFLSLLLTVRYNNLKKEKERLKTEQRYVVANAVIQAQEDERKRLAQDLHDDLGGTVSGLKLIITNHFIQKNNNGINSNFQLQTLQLLDKVVDDVRSIAHNLTPRSFGDLGIHKSIENLIYQINNNQSIQFNYLFSGREQDIPTEVQLPVFRITSELVQNVVRHSKAVTATLQLLLYDNTLHIQLEDDGVGIGDKEKTGGIGLTNVTSRVEFLGGTVNIDSGGQGLIINIEIPLMK